MRLNSFQSSRFARRLLTRALARDAVQSTVESLERRALLAVTASFSSGANLLTVSGDALANTIEVSRNAAGTILVNGGAVAIAGGTPTVANTSTIQVFGLAGNDVITLNEANGALPAADLFGGNDNDTLIGGSGADQLLGQAGDDNLQGKGAADFLIGGNDNDLLTGGDGNDQAFGESGNDRLIWNPGDDTDTNEGGDGTDTVEINGGNGAEQFASTANGTRVRFDRLDPAPFSLDIGTSESLVLNANGGNDSFSAAGNLAALIVHTVDGGSGNDTLLGSNGIDLLLGGDNDDSIDGQQGNDVAFLGSGNDVFIWDPGDGSDVVEGQAGIDRLLFNGSGGSEVFAISANGERALFTRNLGNIIMDINEVEALDVNALGGTDLLTVNDLTGTDVISVNVNHANAIGGTLGDAAADTVVINGNSAGNTIDVFGSGTSVNVLGLAATVNITNNEAANDSLVVNGLGGNDSIAATTVPANVVKLTFDGGDQSDTLLGSQGADVFIGGSGNDFLFGDNGNDLALMGAGNDIFQWDPGDGSDTLEGQADVDKMIFFGSNATESSTITANGSRVAFVRDVGTVTMDLDDVEEIDFRALGGADNIVVGDLTGTAVTKIDLDLRGSSGTPDGAVDTITVNGTQGADTFGAAGNATSANVFGLPATVALTLADPTDQLTLNGQGSADVMDSTAVAANVFKIVHNGGLGNDLLLGGAGDESFNGGDGNDVALMGGGNDTFTWNPGDDSDVLDGEAGTDAMVFNGANVAETFNLSPNGGRVILTRDVANVTMDLDEVEQIDLNSLAGADVITASDLQGTDLDTLNLNLAATGGGGDAAVDTVHLNGSASSDKISISGSQITGMNVGINGLAVHLPTIEASSDVLNVNGLAGADTFVLATPSTGQSTLLNLNFGNADNAGDQLVVNYSAAAETINVNDSGATTGFTGMAPTLTVSGTQSNDAYRINALGGGDTININQAGNVGSIRRVLIDAGDATDTINVNNTAADGTAIILASPGSDNVNVNTDAILQANALFEGTQRIGTLTASASGRVTIAANGASVLTMAALNLTSTAKLDLTNNHAIIDYTSSPSPFLQTRSRIISGYNLGAWNGNGIISSTAAADSSRAIGYSEATTLFGAFPATFRGQSIDNTSVLLTTTLKGDVNLDGTVGFDDLLRIAQNYNAAIGVWTAGDVTYNNIVNFDDLLAVAQNYDQSLFSNAPIAKTSRRPVTDVIA